MYSSARRKSIDSSDSSDSSGSESEYQKKDKKEHNDKSKKKDKDEKKSKDKKDKDKDGKEEKKDKDKKDKDKDGKDEKKDKSGDKDKGHASAAEIDHKQARFHSSQVMDLDQPHTLPPNQHFNAHPPPPHGNAPPHYSSSAQSAPPSGYRVPLTTNSPFPAPQQAGAPASTDVDGSPLFVGSALFDRSVQPCKIGPHLQPYVMVPYGGAEYGHHGRFDLLPFSSETMEWVPTSGGHIPSGRKPIEGGYEESGQKLYHALGQVQGIWIPGKTGEHLGAANVPFGGQEIPLREYSILCWR
ncbi:hypothetical protein ONZ45_g19190 [Pleurotus djamor]|nr:hypothetical protein ONZ45_g19190 [Pleurotus djamor]